MSRHHEHAPDPSRPRPTPPSGAQLGVLGRLGRWRVPPPPLGRPGVARHRGVRRLPRRRRQEGGLGQLPHPRHGLAVGLRPAPGAVLQPERRHRHRRVLGARGPEAHRAPTTPRPSPPPSAALGKVDGVTSVPDPLTTEPPDRSSPSTPAGSTAGRGPGGRGPRPEPAAHRSPPTAAFAYVDRHLRQDASPTCSSSTRSTPRRPARDYANPYSALQQAVVASCRRATSQVAIGGIVANTYNSPVVVVGQPRRRGRPRPRRPAAARRLRLAVRHGHPDRHRPVRRRHRQRLRLPAGHRHHRVVGRPAGDAHDQHRRGPRLLAAHRHPLPPVHRRGPRPPRRRRPGPGLGRQGRAVRRPHRLHRPARPAGSCPSRWCRPSAWPPPSASR